MKCLIFILVTAFLFLSVPTIGAQEEVFFEKTLNSSQISEGETVLVSIEIWAPFNMEGIIRDVYPQFGIVSSPYRTQGLGTGLEIPFVYQKESNTIINYSIHFSHIPQTLSGKSEFFGKAQLVSGETSLFSSNPSIMFITAPEVDCDYDFECDPGEDHLSCPQDCEAEVPGPICGDLICESSLGENLRTCPRDCPISIDDCSTLKDNICMPGCEVDPDCVEKPDIDIIYIIIPVLVIILVLLIGAFRKKRKAQFSFASKGLVLILAIIFIFFLLWISTESQKMSLQISQKFIGIEMSENIVNMLTGSEKCLAYMESDLSGDSYSMRIIDSERLDLFEAEYPEKEPQCAYPGGFGYNVTVKVLDFKEYINTSQNISPETGVFPEIFREVNGKDVVFAVDFSASMSSMIEGCDDFSPSQTKMCCAKKFLSRFFLEMDSGNKISFLRYPGRNWYNNYYGWIFQDKMLDRDRMGLMRYLSGAWPNGNTPMCQGLKASFEHGTETGKDAIVILTDGCENWGCGLFNSVDTALDYKDSAIPVYTVGFGVFSCDETLKRVAEISGGEFFKAITCAELVGNVSPPLNFSIDYQEWNFGAKEKSMRNALKESFRTTYPVTIKRGKDYLPGVVEITIYQGELEMLIELIESACSSGLESRRQMEISYPMKLQEDAGVKAVCFRYRNEYHCKSIKCDKNVEMRLIEPGSKEVIVKTIGQRVSVYA